jgi:alkylation response protein AidB-like acyl-CoA dehydrogenase
MNSINPEQTAPNFDIKSSRKRFDQCAQSGLLKHVIPSNLGGFGDQFSDLVSAHQTLGKDCLDSGLVLSVNAHIWGSVFPIINYGQQEQQQTWLPKLLSGNMLGGHAITEPQAGSDLTALSTTAVASNNFFILNGCKRFITNTPIADLLVVYARMENQLSAFIVLKDDSGVQFTDKTIVSGYKTATMGDVILDNCKIPASRQLGKIGAGNIMIQQALELERAFIFAGIAGIMDWQLQQVIKYSRERIINNMHLGKNQAISHKIADMKLRLETTRLWVNQCARLKDSKQRITLASAQTKLFASEAFLQSSLDAAHIFGASGLIEGKLLAQLVNDAMASRLFSGSSEIQKNIIAALLGTGDGFKPGKI